MCKQTSDGECARGACMRSRDAMKKREKMFTYDAASADASAVSVGAVVAPTGKIDAVMRCRARVLVSRRGGEHGGMRQSIHGS